MCVLSVLLRAAPKGSCLSTLTIEALVHESRKRQGPLRILAQSRKSKRTASQPLAPILRNDNASLRSCNAEFALHRLFLQRTGPCHISASARRTCPATVRPASAIPPVLDLYRETIRTRAEGRPVHQDVGGDIGSYFLCLFVHQNRPATSPQRLWNEAEDGPASDFAARKLAALVPASERSAIQNAVVQI